MNKKIVLILAAAILFAAPLASAFEDVTCRCGYSPGGYCTPCSEVPVPDKTDNSNNQNQPIPDTVCPCGYTPGGICVPCGEGLEKRNETK